jgi:SAM-dependent methyltransferase
VAPPLAFPPGAFRRIDEEDDRVFYAIPRRVVHVDEAAADALTRLYAELIPPRGCVLDLMASWRSHLPVSFAGTVIGLGMNPTEMLDNPRLAQGIVHDVNRDPALPFGDDAFDAVVCAVSVQYLTRPIEVFRDVRRTLRPGAPFIVSFSNRCFPEKAVALWRVATDTQHVSIVTAYFAASDETGRGWGQIYERAHTPPAGDPLYAVWSAKTGRET